MEQEIITQVIQTLFAETDKRNWPTVMATMSDHVLLDYTSMAGGAPVELTPQQIVTAWAAVLPGFDRTHHQLSQFEIREQDTTATAHYLGKAEHFIDDEVWIVEGSYDTELRKENNAWHITAHKLNLSGQSGNTELPAMAAAKVQQRST